MSQFDEFKKRALQGCVEHYTHIAPTWEGPISELLLEEPTRATILKAIPKRINGDMIAELIADRPELMRLKTSWARGDGEDTLPSLVRGLVAFLITKELEPELRAAAAIAGIPTHEQYYDGEKETAEMWPTY